ncbi:cleavage stimulation factor subunit 77-like isoform X1 [Camellia sinensis]|uniref:cleavage stimulation factor subunit 77-like isoform X1 n=1 Tax=Camellia sinensis TaxID=4442 RepID=UPI001035CD06|nr:cleavage stimulation factor subunit 77-like isoform X1 [Camellia sinensis]
MVIYDPRQKAERLTSIDWRYWVFLGLSAPGLPAVSSTLTASSVVLTGGGTPNAPNEFLKATPPALLAFIANLPTVEGPAPDIDFVLSICLQSNIPTGQTGKSVNPSTQLQIGPAPSASDLSGSSKPHPVPSGSSFKTTRDRKRRDADS